MAKIYVVRICFYFAIDYWILRIYILISSESIRNNKCIMFQSGKKKSHKKSLKDDCVVCISGVDASELITLHDRCYVCLECLKTWIMAQTKEHHEWDHTTKFPCFFSRCPCILSLKYIRNVVSPNIRDKIDETLLESYLETTSDIVRCPNRGCGYAEFIPKSLSCSSTVTCQKCRYSWEENRVNAQPVCNLSIVKRVFPFVAFFALAGLIYVIVS